MLIGFERTLISPFALLCLQSCIAQNIEASRIQEDTQREASEIEKKVKKSEILSKFDQLCAFSGSAKDSNYPSFQQ